MKKIHLTQLLYWHNMTLLEQTDILGRRPVCMCVCVCVSFLGGGFFFPHSEQHRVEVGSI